MTGHWPALAFEVHTLICCCTVNALPNCPFNMHLIMTRDVRKPHFPKTVCSETFPFFAANYCYFYMIL